MSLNHKRDEEIKALSGGMQRRLVFVRALLGKPEFLILDEPTTGLDPAVRHLLWSKVQELKAQGVTILLTTHYMDEAEILCDRLLIMDKGAFAAQGHPQQLIRDLAPGYVAHFPQDQSSEARARDLCVSYRHFSLQHHSTGFTLRAPQFGELSQAVNAAGLEPKMIRPANLEDVFLKISGRELADNA